MVKYKDWSTVALGFLSVDPMYNILKHVSSGSTLADEIFCELMCCDYDCLRYTSIFLYDLFWGLVA